MSAGGPRTSEAKLQHLRLLARRSGSLDVNINQAVKVLDLVRRGSSAGEIEAAVQLSPQLAINLVKLASSPAYGAMEISSVKFAIELLGWRELESLMVTLIVSSMANATRGAQVIDGVKMRQRSLVQAFVARALAKAHTPSQSDELYTAGLFLDAGYLLLGIHHPVLLLNLKRTCERTPGIELLEAENEILGFSHAELSAVMAEEFKLSNTVIECLRCHHSPIDASAEAQTAADIACVASGFADEIGLDVIEGLPRIGHDSFACRRLGIDSSALDKTVESLTSKAFLVADSLTAGARAA